MNQFEPILLVIYVTIHYIKWAELILDELNLHISNLLPSLLGCTIYDNLAEIHFTLIRADGRLSGLTIYGHGIYTCICYPLAIDGH